MCIHTACVAIFRRLKELADQHGHRRTMMDGINNYTIARTLGASPPPEINDPKYLDYVADDKQFLAALKGSMSPNQIATTAAGTSIINAATANVGNLSPEERVQIIQSARMIPAAGYRSDPTDSAAGIVRNIERMSNNQGYTGPDAGVVVTTTPTAGGDARQITRGEILDDENFGNLVDSVFTAAGGKSSMPTMLLGRGLPFTGMPGNAFAPLGQRGPLTSVDMTKWSEGERIEYLNKVAEFGKDGAMSSQDSAELAQMAGNNSRNGDNEPIAVKSTSPNFFDKSGDISKDDLMENSTFEKQLNSIALFGEEANGAEAKALKDAIATADYDALGYEERVALVQAFNAASSDMNVTAEEITAITKMLKDFQSGGASNSASGGTTLSNGVVVSDSDVSTDGPDHFVSLVNAVLDRSGVTTVTASLNGTTVYGTPAFTDNHSTVPALRSLDVSKLTSAQRVEILEMISQAGADRQVTRDEAKVISDKVKAMSKGDSASTVMA
jgi:hypothetical protein